MSRILLVGKNGQIGWELQQSLKDVAFVFATDRSELDVTNHQAVIRVFKRVKPDIVINATGYNDVDGAEINKVAAESINVAANTIMATAACKIKAFYLTYSTDYIFDGKKNIPYVEEDLPSPLNVYGQTKLDGEIAILNSGVNSLILRTSSVFSLRRPCFLSSFLKRAQNGTSIQVRSDLVSSPTSARYLADITTQIISMGNDNLFEWLSERKGIYHLAGAGIISRFEWAKAICDILNLNVEVLPSTRLEHDLGANRPEYSALDSSKFFNIFKLRADPWEKMLKTTLDGLS